MSDCWRDFDDFIARMPVAPPAATMQQVVGQTILNAIPETGSYYDVRLRVMRSPDGGGCVVQSLQASLALEPEIDPHP